MIEKQLGESLNLNKRYIGVCEQVCTKDEDVCQVRKACVLLKNVKYVQEDLSRHVVLLKVLSWAPMRVLLKSE